MCGIIGYVGAQGIDVTTLLLDGLSKLEYRGYDSAGIAVLTSAGNLELRRRAGKRRCSECFRSVALGCLRCRQRQHVPGVCVECGVGEQRRMGQ